MIDSFKYCKELSPSIINKKYRKDKTISGDIIKKVKKYFLVYLYKAFSGF